MIRIEIIANHSVEENILEAFEREKIAAHYTKFPGVFGVGSSGPRMGDAIWPEENFVIVVWCEEAEAEGIERAVADVKKYFPEEGIKLFKLRDAPITQNVYLPLPPSNGAETPPAGAGTGAEKREPPEEFLNKRLTKPRRTDYGPEGENR